MDRIAIAFLAAFLCTALILLAVRTLRAGRACSHFRARYFDEFAGFLTDMRIGPGTAGFSGIAGLYEGACFDVQAVPDTLKFRKLPTLWILATLPRILPMRGTLDLMIRPMGVGTFSHFHRLPVQLDLPEGYPEDYGLRTDAPNEILADIVLRPHLHLFDEPTVEKPVISPKGVRIAFLADEAHRGRYIILRDAEMGCVPLTPDDLRSRLDAPLAPRAAIFDARAPDVQRLTA